MSGTFGGFIQLKSPKDGKWHAFGITCFHCVVLEEKDLPTFPELLAEKVRAWYRNGIEVFDETPEKNLLLDHPSLKDMDTKLKYLQDTIKEITSDPKYKEYIQMENEGLADMLPRRDRVSFAAFEEELKNTQRFAEKIHKFRAQGNHQLGFVVAGSGFKQKPAKSIPNARFPSNLDWALIRIRKGREGINFLRDQGRELSQDNPNHGIDLADRSLYIYGRTSGYSEGNYSDLKDAKIETQLHDGKSVHIITLEHSVTGTRGKQFSQQGDSGALVHTKVGSLVGMIFAGADAHNWSYFTHIADLFDDIQKSARAVGVRVLD